MSAAQKLLLPLVPLYAAALAGKNLAYDRGWVQGRTLEWPVVSVGNLTVGGSGKTPVVLALADLLQRAGVAVDVLSRGYGRSIAKGIRAERVEPHADDAAARFGDEPLLLATRGGVPVFVGASRWDAGQLAEAQGGERRVHLLDDGFQHRRLVRAVDCVVLHPQDLEEGLLPAGRLRESYMSLRRAHFLLLREEDASSEDRLRRAGLTQPIWRLRRSLRLPAIQGMAVAFCGIARPREFFTGLRAQGVKLSKTFAFADHHRFTESDLQRVQQAMQETGATAAWTTEKDLVRIPKSMRAVFPGITLQAVPLLVAFAEPDLYQTQLLNMLRL